eukprot:6953491-Pyramimonas_sp.AAC.1
MQQNDVLRGPPGNLAIPGGLRSTRRSPRSKALGGCSGVTHHLDSDSTSPSLEGYDLREGRHFRGKLG